MTEFEEHVAVALAVTMTELGKDDSCGECAEWWAGVLAPHVAAAIDAVADLDEPGADQDNRRVIRETALAALRGGA